MVHFHDLDIPIGAEPARNLFDEPQKQIDPETHVRRPDDRDIARGLADRLALLGRESGRADHHRLAEPGGKRGIRGRSRGCSEIDHDIAVANQLLGAVADRNTDAADAGEFSDIVVDMGAARPGTAARDAATLGRRDLGDQHPPHPAAASDHAHLGPGHVLPPGL